MQKSGRAISVRAVGGEDPVGDEPAIEDANCWRVGSGSRRTGANPVITHPLGRRRHTPGGAQRVL